MHTNSKIESTPLYANFLTSQSAVRKVPTSGMDEGKRHELEQLSHLITSKMDEINKGRTGLGGQSEAKKEEANVERLLHHYIETARNNISPNKSSSFPNTKQGKLKLKTTSAISKWQEKLLILYSSSKKLFICKDNEKHIENDLDLSLFTVKWLGKPKGTKYCLELVQTKILSGQIGDSVKNFVFSSKEERIARDWFNSLIMLMGEGEGAPKRLDHEDKKGNKSHEAEPDDSSRSKKISADSVLGRASFQSDLILSGGRQDSAGPINGKENIWMNKEEIQKLKENMLSNIVSPALKELVRDDVKKTSPSEVVSEGKHAKEGDHKPFSKREEKLQPTIIEEDEENEKRESNVSTGSEIKEKNPASSNLEMAPNTDPFKHDPLKAKMKELLEGAECEQQGPSSNPFADVPVTNSDISEFKIPNETTEKAVGSMATDPKVLSEDERMIQEVPAVFQAFLREIVRGDIFGEESYNMFYMKRGMRVLQNTKNPLEFKLFLTLKFPLEGVLAALLEINKYGQWNRYVKRIKVLNKCDQNTVLIAEERQAYKFFLWPREFTYLRTISKQMNNYYILSNSLDYKFPKSGSLLSTVQGYLRSCTILRPHPSIENCCLMIIINQTDNKGYLKGFLNRKLSFDYLKEFQNLAEFLKEKSFFDPSLLPARIVYKKEKEVKKKISFKKAESELLEEEKRPEAVVVPGILKEEKAEESSAEASPINMPDPTDNPRSEAAEKFFESVIPETKATDWSLYTQEAGAHSCVDKQEEHDADEFLEYVNQGKHVATAITAKHVVGVNPADVKKDHHSNNKEPHVLHADFAKSKTGGLLYLNKKVIDDQKRVLSFMLKKMGTNLLSGKSIMSVSLPVDIFDEHSVLKRTAISFAHAPSLLERAGEVFDPMEQFKATIAFLISTLYTTLSQRKPFNPILGETYQARINGCPVVLEQISHHPPISAFFMEGHNYWIKGNLEMCASLHANSVTGKQRGVVKVIFKNTQSEIRFSMPPCNINGITFGQRTLNFEGVAFVFDPKNDLFCELHFNPDKKGLIGGLFSKQKTQKDFYNGQIMKISEASSKKMEKLTDYSKFPGLKEKEDVLEVLGGVEGIWHENCDIMGKTHWRLEEFHPYPLEVERNPLPSDSRFREDVIVWKTGNVKRAQESKEKLENLQRADRKLRAKFGGGHH